MALEPIDIIIHDYPSSFPTHGRTFVYSTMSFLGNIKYKVELEENIKSISNLNPETRMIIDGDVFAKSMSYLKAESKFSDSFDTTIITTTKLKPMTRLAISDQSNIKTVASFNPTIGVYFNWEKDTNEVWSDLPSTITIGEYVKQSL